MYNDVARYTGEALHTYMQQSGTACQKPILVGFANLHDVNNDNEHKIREDRIESRSIVDNVVTGEQVHCRSFDRVHQ